VNDHSGGASYSKPTESDESRKVGREGQATGDRLLSDGNRDHVLSDVLDRIDHSADKHNPLAAGQLMDELGQQTFVPLLLLAGLIMMVPGPADIPGVPVVIGLFVILVAVQILMRREHLWIPNWMEHRQLASETVKKMVGWARRPARWLDRITETRWTRVINHAGGTVIAVACILIAATTPVLEFVPFSANLAGAAITAFALALLARDGLFAAIAITLAVGTVLLVGYQFI